MHGRIAQIAEVAGNRAGRAAVRRLLTLDLPGELRHKSQLTEKHRSDIAASAVEFTTAERRIRTRYELLGDLGFDLPRADALVATAAVARALAGHLSGRFTATKQLALVRDYTTVKQAETAGVAAAARRELDAIYPVDDHVPMGRTLNKLLKNILLAARGVDEYVSYEFLRKYIDRASPQERAAAGRNPRLVDLALERLAGRSDLPKLLADLQVVDTGTVDHYTPAQADELIRDRLALWLPDVVMHDRGIAGHAAVLKGEAWERVLTSYLVGTPPGEIRNIVATTNAFTAPDGRVFVAADRGNPGTMIHEGIHFYAPDAFLRAYRQPLNEGVTEYFARKITTELDIERTNYPGELAMATKLVEMVGEDAVKQAYFKGDLAPLAGVDVDQL